MPKQYQLDYSLCLSVLIALTPTSIFASDQVNPNSLQLETMELSDLLSMEISTASVATETLLDAPAPMYVLTRKEIRERGYVDITDIMKDLPGFDNAHVAGSGELYTYQRGFRSSFNSRTLVLLNGRNFTPLWYQSVPLGPMIPIEAIEQIEILYGPAGAIYGPNAFLGVINIITSDASSLETGTHQIRASSSAGSYNTKRVDIHAMAKLSDSISMTLTARFGRTDGADVSDRDNKWLREDYTSSETIWGPILDRSSNGYDYGGSGNPDDDHMFMASLTLGNFELDAYTYLRSASNGPEYAGDRIQPKNFWHAVGNGVSIEHNKQLNENIQLESKVTFRTSGTYGLWLDAAPSWDEGQSEYSYLAYVDFHTMNNALAFEQKVAWDVTDDVKVSAGYRFLRKQLTKAYDIGDGYWEAYNSNGADDNSAIYNTVPCDIDPDDDVTGDGYTNYETGDCEPWDNGEIASHRMPLDNLVLTEDVGGFVEVSYTLGDFKLNLGARYDINSNPQVAPEDKDDATSHRGYRALSPRVGLIYRFFELGLIEAGAVKLLYGEAVQEPGPAQLWGGWNGRDSVDDLRPERARNTELVLLLQTGSLVSDFSLYFAEYEEVHVEPAANAGMRQALGVEYKGRLSIPHFISDWGDIGAYLNVSYTQSQSDTKWEFESESWIDADGLVETGDIAAIKAHAGINLPLINALNINVRGRYIGGRTPFLANKLRDSSKKDYFPGYFVGDLAVAYYHDIMTFTAQVYNFTNTDYNHTGDGAAGAGDGWEENADGSMNTAVRSAGYRNSLVPQPLRNLMFTFTLDI